MSYEYEFELPLNVIIKRKKTKDKKVSISFNSFRTLHHRQYNEAKELYKKIVSTQFKGLIKPSGKLHCHYEYYAARNNKPDLDNFVGGAKKFFQDAMVECGFIEADDVNVICSNSEKYMGIDKENPRIIVKIQELAKYKFKCKELE